MIGIVGFGFVGQAVYAALSDPTSAMVYDKHKAAHSENPERVLETEALFICVPTPTTKQGYQDASAIIGILAWLNKNAYQGLVVIKSTLLYETVKAHSGLLQVVMNPEFLSQNTALDDFRDGIVVLGGEMDVCRAVQAIYQTYFMPEFEFLFCTSEEACQLKYVHNIYHAYKALFWNWVFEVTGNHRRLFQLYTEVRPDPIEMAHVAADGRLGIGGACFPKDVAAFNHEYPHELTRFILEYNKRLRPDALG